MVTPQTTITALPEPLQAELERAASAEDRSTGEMLAEAVTGYLKERSWQKLIQSARERTTALGLVEEDVPRLIAESRTEQEHDQSCSA